MRDKHGRLRPSLRAEFGEVEGLRPSGNRHQYFALTGGEFHLRARETEARLSRPGRLGGAGELTLFSSVSRVASDTESGIHVVLASMASTFVTKRLLSVPLTVGTVEGAL